MAIPEDMMDKSKLQALSYESVIEALAERFHASPMLLTLMNPNATFQTAGEQILVPNVTTAPPPKAARVIVDKSDRSVTALDAQGKVIAYYPATIGSNRDPLPIGKWKINGVQNNPTFHYNPNLFWDADPSHSKAKIPSGPNNPVGVVWIDLSKEHYGIHGTPEPKTIGKTQSHGCIRLTNWDAVESPASYRPECRRSCRSDTIRNKALLVLLSGASLTGAVLVCVHLAGLKTEARDQAQVKTEIDAEADRDARYAPSPRVARPAGPPRPSIPAQSSDKPPLPGGARLWGLSADNLGLPLAGLRSSNILDTFNQARGAGERKHEAVDIMAPRGTPVLAITTGPVKKLFLSKPGGLTVYQFDRDDVYCFYYAHLDRYATGIAEGVVLRRGDVLGYVGSTGNANPGNPHLHLAIFHLGPEKKWWQGTPINPYPILQRLVERVR